MKERLPVPRVRLFAMGVLLVLRMLRAAVVMGYRCWRLKPDVGDQFNVTYTCNISFEPDQNGKLGWPRTEETL